MTSQGRQYPDGPLEPPSGRSPSMELQQAMTGVGAAFLAGLLGAPEQPGPPWVHTFVPPEPIGQDEDGNDIYPPPGPAYTMREIPLAELVDPDRPWWLVRAAEACRPEPSLLARIAAEAVGAPVRIEVGEPLGPPDEFRWVPGEGVRFEIGAIVPPGPRIEITADFCQCLTCREARCEP